MEAAGPRLGTVEMMLPAFPLVPEDQLFPAPGAARRLQALCTWDGQEMRSPQSAGLRFSPAPANSWILAVLYLNAFRNNIVNAFFTFLYSFLFPPNLTLEFFWQKKA